GLVVPGPGVSFDCATRESTLPRTVGREVGVGLGSWVPPHDAEPFEQSRLHRSFKVAHHGKVSLKPIATLLVRCPPARTQCAWLHVGVNVPSASKIGQLLVLRTRFR